MGKSVVALSLLFVSPVAALAQGIAQGYPGDVGIENNANVIYVERFDDASLSTVLARYSQARPNNSMLLDTDIPPGSRGGRSLRITATGGQSWGGDLYRLLPENSDRWHVRYYAKFATGMYHHTGVWFGGYNPPISWPNPRAGIRPTGNDRFSVAMEPFGTDRGQRFDLYVYWMGMRRDPDGNYWGNSFINNPSNITYRYPIGAWTCVEVMVKLNNPVSSTNGELACWVNGTQVANLGPGFPKGVWARQNQFYPDAGGTAFEGFQWRNSSGLKLNNLWIQHFDENLAAGAVVTAKFDHLVVARSYIGPISGGGTTAPPTITQQPQNQSVTTGQTATFTVTANGTAPLSYQWQRQVPGGAGFADLAGATAASYTTPAATTAMNGTQYRVRVSNSAGSVTSSAAVLTLTTNPTAPTITQQPQNRTVTAGQTASFTVTASGTAPLSYQWQKRDPGGATFADIPGATSASYATPVTTSAMSGTQYRVRVSNTAGNATSSAATLTVNAASLDSDGDGLPDAWEQQHFGGLTEGPGDNPDGDHHTNLQEFQAGTDPMDPASFPGASLPTSGDGGGKDGHCGMGSVSAGSFSILWLGIALSLLAVQGRDRGGHGVHLATRIFRLLRNR